MCKHMHVVNDLLGGAKAPYTVAEMIDNLFEVYNNKTYHVRVIIPSIFVGDNDT